MVLSGFRLSDNYLPDECWIVTSRNTSELFLSTYLSTACVVGNYKKRAVEALKAMLADVDEEEWIVDYIHRHMEDYEV